jgi:hypothetical protein
MGCIISAKCVCGFADGNVTIGAGMSNFKTTCVFPACCKTGHHLASVNLLGTESLCHGARPVPYTAPELRGGSTTADETVVQWSGHELKDGTYLCPRCGKFDLTFSPPHLMFD